MDPIDRVTSARHPGRLAVAKQRWRQLLFLHWAVPISQLMPLVPDELEIDTFEGNAYVSLIPFTISGNRPAFLPPIPPFASFHEVNLRTYVHFEGRDPGVWFFTLEAASRAAVAGGRLAYKLPYHYSTITMTRLHPTGSGIDYTARRPGSGAGCHVVYTTGEATPPARPDTIDHFLIERYFLYAANSRALYRAQVHHRPYPLRAASVRSFDESLMAASRILRPPSPALVHYSPGVDVSIFKLDRIRSR